MTSYITHAWNRAALFVLYTKGGTLTFAPTAWVPDEYETLERLGLITCDFGYYDSFNPSLQSRVIKLTNEGLSEAKKLKNVKVPQYVGYSYHSALKRERLI